MVISFINNWYQWSLGLGLGPELLGVPFFPTVAGLVDSDPSATDAQRPFDSPRGSPVPGPASDLYRLDEIGALDSINASSSSLGLRSSTPVSYSWTFFVVGS